jgi:chromosome segregation protein
VRAEQARADTIRTEALAQQREADRRGQDVGRAKGRVERLRQELERAGSDREAAAAALVRTRVELEEFLAGARPGGEAGEEAALQQAREQLQAAEEEQRSGDRAVTELRVRLAQQEQRLQSALAASRRAEEGGAFLDRQRSERLKEQGALTAEREQRQLAFTSFEQELRDAEAAIARARDDQARLGAQREEWVRRLNEARTGTQALGSRLRELLERSHRAQVELTAVDNQRAHFGQQWLDSVISLRMEREDSEDDERPPPTVAELMEQFDPLAAESVLTSYSDPDSEIARLRRQIRALGPVNLDAVEQFAATEERHAFLTRQRADLEAAREQLEGAIREIDAASRETFMRAFREIAAAFDEMFKKLFGGGATELRLTDPEDLLETGIDVIVQPPGKKQQNLLLLSGGERALTASAMLFALLKVKPSPFCVMDEVDAPLDETNVGRFTAALRDFSERTQFILVTHNRGTMEDADTLYGVTMEERGVSKILSCTLSDSLVVEVEAEQRVPTHA